MDLHGHVTTHQGPCLHLHVAGPVGLDKTFEDLPTVSRATSLPHTLCSAAPGPLPHTNLLSSSVAVSFPESQLGSHGMWPFQVGVFHSVICI